MTRGWKVGALVAATLLVVAGLMVWRDPNGAAGRLFGNNPPAPMPTIVDVENSARV